MKDINEVLRQKESDCSRLQKEIDALRIAIPLLTDDSERSTEESEQPEEQGPTVSSSQTSSGSRFWRRRRENEG